MRRQATPSPVRSHLTIGGMALSLACLCLLAATAFAGTGTAAAAECPNEAIRIEQGSTYLPDCRAFERISPADSKGGVVGVDTKNRPMFAAMRADGDAADFGSSSAVGETERGSTIASNLARRTPDGWKSFNVMTTTEPGVLMELAMATAWPTPSSDMSRMMFTTSRSLGPPNLTTGRSIYLSAPEGKGPPTWLSHWTLEGTQPNSPNTGSAFPLGGSPDFSSGYFSYPGRLTDIAGDDLRTSVFGLYFFEGEKITPAGVLPSGTVSQQGAYPAGIGSAASTGAAGILPELAHNQVSADGSRLFFVSPTEGTEPKQLYVEEGGAPGRLISHDALGAPAASGITNLAGGSSQFAQSEFAAATPDGSRVVFRSESALTADAPEAGIKTYRAQIAPGATGAITLTYLPEVDGTVLQIDDDASTILFSTPGSVSYTSSYYVWDEGRPAAPYTIATEISSNTSPMLEPVFSDDGDVLAFASVAEIEPGITGGSVPQIFRWTKQGGTPLCISCRRDGGLPGRFGARMSNFNGASTDNPARPTGDRLEAFNQSTVVNNRKISADGSRVFFDTNDPLDPARDVNGTRDVYMWENGHDYLLTSGRGDDPSLVLDSSENGDDVMFVTKDGLIPSDTNGTYDVYDARVDGGFPEPVAEPCEGAACQTTRATPAASPPGSRGIIGPGNRQQVKLGGVKVTQIGKPGRTARVKVKVPAAGKVKLAGKLLKPQARKANAKGTIKAKVALTKAGMKKLAAKGSLKAKVTATFRDSEGHTRKSSVTLRFRQGGHR